jgi:hypothetical protein
MVLSDLPAYPIHQPKLIFLLYFRPSVKLFYSFLWEEE